MKRSRTGTGDLVQVKEVKELGASWRLTLLKRGITMKTLIIAITLVALAGPALACARASCPKGATCICQTVGGEVRCEVVKR